MAVQHRHESGMTGHDIGLRDDDRFAGYGAETKRSNVPAFLMGGIVVAGGLLAFLYYDTDRLNSRVNLDLTTGSISRTAPAVGEAVPNIRLAPAAPKDVTGR